jgi:hypothetical protein
MLRSNRPNFSRLSFAVFGLAFSVFTWGLQYKLSLYDPPQNASHTIPEAKLLSKDEQAVVTKGVTIADTKVPAEHIFFWCTFLSFLLPRVPAIFLPKGRAEQDLQRPSSVSRFASLNAFFFRPPPASV